VDDDGDVFGCHLKPVLESEAEVLKTIEQFLGIPRVAILVAGTEGERGRFDPGHPAQGIGTKRTRRSDGPP
jgi:hypothetical protein